jgi:hypothetical protein
VGKDAFARGLGFFAINRHPKAGGENKKTRIKWGGWPATALSALFKIK